MKNLFSLVAAVILVISFQNHALCADDCKFGAVDIEKFQEESKSFEIIREGLKQKYESLQEKLEEKKAELVEIEKELKKQSMMLSLDAKEDKEKELEKKRRQYKYLADEFTQEMKQAQLEVRKKLAKELEKVVEKIGVFIDLPSWNIFTDRRDIHYSLTRQFRTRKRQQIKYSASARQRLSHFFHQQKILGTCQDKLAGLICFIHNALDVREQLRYPLNFIKDYRVIELIQESPRIL